MGKAVTVEVSYIDAQNTAEGPLVSVATAAVGNNQAPVIDTTPGPAPTPAPVPTPVPVIPVPPVVVDDNQNEFIVILGEADDILHGNGGDDIVGSLDGNDQIFGDNGNDVVFGGAGQDRLSGGSGNDRLNGGFGFDLALQQGNLNDYTVTLAGNSVVLTHKITGAVDTLIDVEQVKFDTGASLVIAHSEREAVAQHLVSTWLGRDLTPDEGVAVQAMEGVSIEELTNTFRTLLAPDDLKVKTNAELLLGLDSNPHILRLDVNRHFTGTHGDDQGYLPMGLALEVDGLTGFDVLNMTGSRAEVYVTEKNGMLELTRYQDGAMLHLKNAEMIAFDNGNTLVLAHNFNEATLGRLVQTFFNRSASVDEWHMGVDALNNPAVSPDSILNWFQDHADLKQLSDSDYIQALYENTLGRQANADELNGYVNQLQTGTLDRNALAVDVAQSPEAINVVGTVMQFDGWM